MILFNPCGRESHWVSRELTAARKHCEAAAQTAPVRDQRRLTSMMCRIPVAWHAKRSSFCVHVTPFFLLKISLPTGWPYVVLRSRALDLQRRQSSCNEHAQKANLPHVTPPWRFATISHRQPVVGRPAGPSREPTASLILGSCLILVSWGTPKTRRLASSSKMYKPSCTGASVSRCCIGLTQVFKCEASPHAFAPCSSAFQVAASTSGCKADTAKDVAIRYTSAARWGNTNCTARSRIGGY